MVRAVSDGAGDCDVLRDDSATWVSDAGVELVRWEIDHQEAGERGAKLVMSSHDRKWHSHDAGCHVFITSPWTLTVIPSLFSRLQVQSLRVSKGCLLKII